MTDDAAGSHSNDGNDSDDDARRAEVLYSDNPSRYAVEGSGYDATGLFAERDGVLGGAPPQPPWLITLDTPRGYCRDFNIAVESGFVGGPQRSLICLPVHLPFLLVIRFYLSLSRVFCWVLPCVLSFTPGRAFGTRFVLSRRKF